MTPVFFSVSNTDVAFAEWIWDRLPSDLAFLYSKNGEDGVVLWDEISEKKLPKCSHIVVFWSKNFPKAGGCVKELEQAAAMVDAKAIYPLILRLDDYPITYSDDLPADEKDVFSALNSLLNIRTSSQNITQTDALDLVQRVIEPVLAPSHPELPRLEQAIALRERLGKDRFTLYPAVWLSGFNGVGRKTLVKEVCRPLTPNGRAIEIEINEASLPKVVAQRLLAEGLQISEERRAAVEADESYDSSAKLGEIIEQIFDAGHYTVIRHQRLVDENVSLPSWLDETINALKVGNRPKVFILSQLPIANDRRIRCQENMIDFRLPTLSEDETENLVEQLISHFDQEPNRWNDETIRHVAHAGGGTPDLVVKLVRMCCRFSDLSDISAIVRDDVHHMREAMTTYVRWAFDQLGDDIEAKRALLFLQDVSPCDPIDIAKFLATGKPILQILFKLTDYGLVERGEAGLYRLTPLLAKRLGRDLVQPQLLEQHRAAMKAFAESPIDLDGDEHGYARIESRIQAALLTDDAKLSNHLSNYVSAAHWFQAGVRLYHARHREAAYRLLKKAYEKRDAFRDVSKQELLRYFGLSAIRNKKPDDANACINSLDAVHTTKPLATFLRAYQFDHDDDYYHAKQEYELALNQNTGRDARLEHIYRPLIRCILKLPPIDYVNAERHAKASMRVKETVFSKTALAKVYLQWGYSDAIQPDDLENRYNDAMESLRIHPGGKTDYLELLADRAVLDQNFTEAVARIDETLQTPDSRFELRLKLWQILGKSRDPAMARRAVDEIESAKRQNTYRNYWDQFLEGTVEAYMRALRVCGNYNQSKLSQLAPNLSGHQIAKIVSGVNRGDNS
jgi:hypothetical protein